MRLEVAKVHNLASNRSRIDYNIYYENQKLCDYQVVKILKNNALNGLLGSYPSDFQLSNKPAPSFESAFNYLTTQFSDINIYDSGPCLFKNGDKYESVHRIPGQFNEDQRVVYVNSSEILESINNKESHLDVTTQIFDNVNDGKTIEYKLTGLSNDGSLSNSYFDTQVEGGFEKITDISANFTIDTSSDGFRELSMFANANRMLSFYNDLGFEWAGDKITLVVNHSNENNAEYNPGARYIALGNGDGKELQNLATDVDVVSHEFGHHIMVQSLTNLSSFETLMLRGVFRLF